ncbi:MAG: hypothetical protein LDL33_12055, partial [Desulfomonile sp.]|nr:hypothetical protein [Desulfomonile sp.]
MTPVVAVRALAGALVLCLGFLLLPIVEALAKKQFIDAVRIVAPDGLSTRVLSAPDPKAEVRAMVLHGEMLEVLNRSGMYIEVKLPDANSSGWVLRSHTEPWRPPEKRGRPLLLPIAIALGVIAVGAAAFLFMRQRKAKEVERRAAMISESIRDAEDLFRSGDHAAAIQQFVKYIELQGGEVRNPDVY